VQSGRESFKIPLWAEAMMPAKTPTALKSKVRHSPMEHPGSQYPQETAVLQAIAENCGLTEKIKWGKPCFMHGSSNIVLIQRFNDYIALMFFKGALLKDPEKLLHRIGKHMQAPRQLRFTTAAEIKRRKPTIEAYIREAIAVEESGARVPRRAVTELAIPEELQTKLNSNRKLKEAFFALTPGRQKHYIFEIAAAKQSSTRASRVEKYTPQILAGKGLRD
jgi:uncharacterized protein YdeI (YjbR/CyaY-like superfamily)